MWCYVQISLKKTFTPDLIEKGNVLTLDPCTYTSLASYIHSYIFDSISGLFSKCLIWSEYFVLGPLNSLFQSHLFYFPLDLKILNINIFHIKKQVQFLFYLKPCAAISIHLGDGRRLKGGRGGCTPHVTVLNDCHGYTRELSRRTNVELSWVRRVFGMEAPLYDVRVVFVDSNVYCFWM